MTKKQPLISIIVPVYNAGKFLDQCLQSILAQTYSHWELIAINDGSTDESRSLLRQYAQIDKRITVLKNRTNQGIAISLNKAIKKARGQYIARMDADDVMYPNRLEKQIRYLLQHPKTVVVGGQCDTINISSEIIGHKKFPATNKKITSCLYFMNPVQHPTMLINRQLLPQNFHFYDDQFPPAEDLDLLFRLRQYGSLHNLKDTLIQYRQYADTATFRNPVLTFSKTLAVRQKAIQRYAYSPTLYARIAHLCQKIAIKILPGSLIYYLYTLIRGINQPQVLALQSVNALPKSIKQFTQLAISTVN